MSERIFYSPELSRHQENIVDQFAQEEAKKAVLDILESPKLQEQILRGNITLAMIRPNVGPDANNLSLPDADAANRIEEMITGLGISTKFSFLFTKDAAIDFYKGPAQTSMEKEPPIDRQYSSRWPEFCDFMVSSPTTALLLYSPDGDAIERWRSHLGHWNIDEIRDPSTIRGALGVNKYNNLVHGSDQPSAVLRELEIIRSCIGTKS